MGARIRSGVIRLNLKNKWKYESIEDPKYIKDKDEFFKKSGNGWWVDIDTSLTRTKLKKRRENERRD